MMNISVVTGQSPSKSNHAEVIRPSSIKGGNEIDPGNCCYFYGLSLFNRIFEKVLNVYNRLKSIAEIDGLLNRLASTVLVRILKLTLA